MQHEYRVGQRIEVIARWSTFRGKRGTISAIAEPLRESLGPRLMIQLDDERKPLAFECVAIGPLVGAQSEPNLTGAE